MNRYALYETQPKDWLTSTVWKGRVFTKIKDGTRHPDKLTVYFIEDELYFYKANGKHDVLRSSTTRSHSSMNRAAFNSEVKIAKPVKPSFVPTQWNRGDKVINTQELFTEDGYFEIGCEFMIRGWNEDFMFVNQILGDILLHKDLKFPHCFKVVDKDWLQRYYPS